MGAVPPLEPASLLALALAALLFTFAPSVLRVPSRWLVLLAAASATALSAAYVLVYLRGGPRIIDATTYFFEGRALAEGQLTTPLAEPEASTLGRFFVRAEGPDGPTFAGLFPPGYPALLALGFGVGAPLAVGPALAFALVVATFALAKRALPTRAAEAARVAALLSVACAALRYHTADTMSHGLAALCFTGALACSFGASDARSRGGAAASAAGAGLLFGWLAATRPPSALALAICLIYALFVERPRPGRRALSAATFALGALPGIGLLVVQQHAVTGAWLASSQRVYYAASDGPPGCFTYGFGADIGCLGEHGDFVRANLAHGYGLGAALLTTARRLKMHLVDAGNAEPLALLVPLGAALGWGTPRLRVLAVGVGAVMLAYVPFYFDGNYPGGGARFFADVLPLEHVLLAFAALACADRLAPANPRARLAVVPLALLGFTVRASFDHASLRERDGGAPMVNEAALAPAEAEGALVFFDTDHGFSLAFDPSEAASLKVARYRGDALDHLRWTLAGEPPSYRYRFDLAARGGAPNGHLEPYVPAATGRIEGESLWPPRAQRAGFALPTFEVPSCVSGGRGLALVAHRGRFAIDLSLPSALVSGRAVAPRLVLGAGARVRAELTWPEGRFVWENGGAEGVPSCVELPRFVPPPSRGPYVLSLEGEGEGPVALDAVLLESD